MISSLLFSTLIAFGALSPIPARASTTGILDRHPQQAHSNPDRLKPDVKKPDVKKPDVKKPDHIKTNPINLLVNGDFRRRFQNMPAEWGGHEGLSSKPRDAAHPHCLRTSLPFSQDGYASQYLPLDGQRIRQVRFAVSAAWQNVRQGRDENNTCRATLLFFDAHGGVIGEFVDLGHWTGTSKGWQRYSHLFEVPAHTRRIQITLGLNGCSGTAWFSDARLEVTRGDLTYHTPPYSRTNTKGWMVWEDPSQSNAQSNEPPRNTRNTQKKGQKQTSNTHEYPIPPIPNTPNTQYPRIPPTPNALTPNALNVSFLLDGPAGKHGFTRAGEDGHLYFADGSRARFWGVDIMADACFPDHATARKMCARLAHNGIDMVRLHHIDAPWSKPAIIDPRYNDTQHLDAAALERLDYFVSLLREAGIYVYLDLLTNRHFKTGDAVRNGVEIEDGLKIVAHFDPRIKELHKKYIHQLLTHLNPYTHLRWLDDPALALMEVINEDSLLYEDWYTRVPPAYMRDLRRLCRQIDPHADPAREPFDTPTRRALYRIETDYYAEMRGYLRKLGVRCATTGSNHWEDLGVALRADSRTDYIDRHFYWDHPEGGFGYFQRFDNTPMLTNPLDNGLLPILSQMRVAKKPFVVTEWCFCWPNDQIAEGPLIGTLAACQQDWDAMIWFDFSGNNERGGTDWDDTIDNEFDLSNKPHLFGQWPAAALAFHRRDIGPLGKVFTATASDADLFAGRLLADGFPTDAAFTHRLETQLGAARSRPALPTPFPPLKPVWQTPQSKWDSQRGLLSLNTPCTVALVGFTGEQTVTLGNVTLSPDKATPFSAIWLSSLDGEPLERSRHILVTATAHAENTAMIMTPGRTSVTNPGHAPILVEAVHATIRLKYSPLPDTEWHAYALDIHGNRREPISFNDTEMSLHFHMGETPTLWVELTR